MKTKIIYKHKLSLDGINKLVLPVWSVVLSVQVQNGEFTLWVESIEQAEETQERFFEVILTGQSYDAHQRRTYITTIQHENHVFHVFELFIDIQNKKESLFQWIKENQPVTYSSIPDKFSPWIDVLTELQNENRVISNVVGGTLLIGVVE